MVEFSEEFPDGFDVVLVNKLTIARHRGHLFFHLFVRMKRHEELHPVSSIIRGSISFYEFEDVLVHLLGFFRAEERCLSCTQEGLDDGDGTFPADTIDPCKIIDPVLPSMVQYLFSAAKSLVEFFQRFFTDVLKRIVFHWGSGEGFCF